MKIMDVGNIPATLFSPAKMVYVAYVLLCGLRVLPAPSVCLFLVLSALFLVIEVFHNDYLRILLNKAAEKSR